MTLGVVIPCYRQERFLPRTLAALETALTGREWRGVLVLSATDSVAPPAPGAHWRLLRACGPTGTPALTPGAARNAGFRACSGSWVLFVDADVEVERAWIDRAYAEVARGAAFVGAWGRIEERFETDRGERAGLLDLYRVGEHDADAGYTATLSLYRRDALEQVGGYDARLNSEEDFELGLRLRRAGFRLRTLAPRAALHWSAPRPSFGEYGRRWRTGLCFGPGQALRLYAGKPGFGELVRRNAHYFAMLALWLALPVVFARFGPPALLAWASLLLALLGLMWFRKRSARLAIHSLTTWTVLAAGMVVGFVRGGAHPPPRVQEVA